ncbi:MAG: hypothetical protein EOO88_19330 [Pedobacter sp.]|nr:MAG: hypothetical protein EOO88_19330 [Pedobacter sp.]
MKNLLFTAAFSLMATLCFAQEPAAKPIVLKNQIVEASCGTCNFGLTGKSCELAVKIDATSYFVDGTTIKDHGDSHAKDGFCNAVRKAKVSGSVVNGRFKSRSFVVQKADKAKQVQENK